MEVFQERVAEQIPVFGLPDDCRNRGFASELGGAQAALTHNQFVARFGLLGEELSEFLRTTLRGDTTNDDGLENADLLDRGRQFLQIVLIKDLSRLLCVGNDLIDRNFSEGCSGHREKLVIDGCFT